MLYSGEERNVFQGPNPVSEFYLYNVEKEKGKVIPRIQEDLTYSHDK